MFCREASKAWFCRVMICAWVGAGAGGRVATTRVGGLRGRRRATGATTRVSGRTLLPPACCGTVGAGGCGVAAAAGCGVAAVDGGGAVLSLCANAAASDAVSRASDETDNSSLRRRRVEARRLVNIFPDPQGF